MDTMTEEGPEEGPDERMLEFQKYLEGKGYAQNTVAEYERILYAIIEQYGSTIVDQPCESHMSMVRSGPGSLNVIKHALCVLKHYQTFWAARRSSEASEVPAPIEEARPSVDRSLMVVPACLPEECRHGLGQVLQTLDGTMAKHTQVVQEEARQLSESLSALQRFVTPLLNVPCITTVLRRLPSPERSPEATTCAEGSRPKHRSRKLLPEELDAIDVLAKDVMGSQKKRRAAERASPKVSKSLRQSNALDGHVMRPSKRSCRALEPHQDGPHGFAAEKPQNEVVDGTVTRDLPISLTSSSASSSSAFVPDTGSAASISAETKPFVSEAVPLSDTETAAGITDETKVLSDTGNIAGITNEKKVLVSEAVPVLDAGNVAGIIDETKVLVSKAVPVSGAGNAAGTAEETNISVSEDMLVSPAGNAAGAKEAKTTSAVDDAGAANTTHTHVRLQAGHDYPASPEVHVPLQNIAPAGRKLRRLRRVQ